MADAIPVNDPEVTPEVEVQAPVSTSKKKNSNGINADVLAEIKAQAREEVLAEQAAMAIPKGASVDDSFKVAGGVELVSHKAVREDF